MALNQVKQPSSPFIWPQNKLGYDAPPTIHALLLRTVAPNEEGSIKWLVKHASGFQLVGNLIFARPWLKACEIQLPKGSFVNHETEYAIFKTHRKIVEEIRDIGMQRVANALLSYIVWFRKDKHPDGEIARQQTYALRRAILDLAKNNRLPAESELDAGFVWLADLEVMLADESEEVGEDFRDVKKLLLGELAFGKRRKAKSSRTKKSVSDRVAEEIWGTRPDYEWDFSTEPFDLAVAATPPIAIPVFNAKVAEDDGTATDGYELKGSKRSGSDAAYKARRLANTVLIGGISGYDHKETYTADVAGFLLSHLAPRSPEAVLAVTAIALGRPLKNLKQIEVSGNHLILDSLQNPGRPIRLEAPSPLDLSTVVPVLEEVNKSFKKLLRPGSVKLGCRIAINGLARFGVMRFHGELGVVQSEQLQGDLATGRVTAIYGSLSSSDFQRAFNGALKKFCHWVGDEAPYINDEWRLWASELERTGLGVATDNYKFGSERAWALSDEAKKKISNRLKDSHECYEEASNKKRRDEEALEYLQISALSLNIVLMAITGMRPLTSTTKLSVGSGCVSVADKRCYGELETRVLPVPRVLITSLRTHLENVRFVLTQLNGIVSFESSGLRHPFIYIALNKQGSADMQHLSQAEVLAWQRDIAADESLSANALRHNKTTEMLIGGVADGVAAQMLGHDRAAVSGSSPYISTPALCEYQNTFDGVPVIKPLWR